VTTAECTEQKFTIVEKSTRILA